MSLSTQPHPELKPDQDFLLRWTYRDLSVSIFFMDTPGICWVRAQNGKDPPILSWPCVDNFYNINVLLTYVFTVIDLRMSPNKIQHPTTSPYHNDIDFIGWLHSLGINRNYEAGVLNELQVQLAKQYQTAQLLLFTDTELSLPTNGMATHQGRPVEEVLQTSFFNH